MGVDHTVHIVYGIGTKNKKEIEYINDVIRNLDDPDFFASSQTVCDVLLDNYGSKYAVIGDIVGSHSKHNDGGFEEIPVGCIPWTIQHEIREYFPELFVGMERDQIPVRLMAVSHFY